MPKKKVNKEAEQAVLELLKATPIQVGLVVGAGVYLLPRALEYLVSETTQRVTLGSTYLLNALWKGATGKADEAKSLIEDSGKWTREQYDELLGFADNEESWRKLNPDFTTTTVYDEISIEDYAEKMMLPPSVLFFKYPEDNASSMTLMMSGNWAYYGQRTINGQVYALFLPATIRLYVYEDITETETIPMEENQCPGGYEYVIISGLEMCTRITLLHVQETQVFPTINRITEFDIRGYNKLVAEFG